MFGLSRFGQLPFFSGLLSGFLFGLCLRLQALVRVLGQSLNKSGREYIGRGPPSFADVLTRPFFKFFICSNDFVMQKVYFSQLMRDYIGLIMLAACTKSRFLCSLLVSRVWDTPWVIGLCFPLAEGLQILRQRQPLLVQCKQQASPLLLMNIYTPLMISRNDKNKQLTLLSQLKLALTAINTLTCHQKTNQPRETVPLKCLSQRL